ncbi:MAG TPA: hypothetical protein VHD76_17375 [Bryobacteraceae bacterium]|nr:hypothetical protein [Bryobacteraceae bacterium]
MEEIFAKLCAADIQILPLTEIPNHFVFERRGFVCLVERRESSFGAIGASGVLTPKGLAVLVWRGASPYFVAKGFEQAATPEQVDMLRAFSRDLEEALKQP